MKYFRNGMPFAVSYIALTVYPILLIFAVSLIVKCISASPFRRDHPSTTLRPPRRSRVRWQEANSCVAVDAGIIYATDAFTYELTVVDEATADMCS